MSFLMGDSEWAGICYGLEVGRNSKLDAAYSKKCSRGGATMPTTSPLSCLAFSSLFCQFFQLKEGKIRQDRYPIRGAALDFSGSEGRQGSDVCFPGIRQTSLRHGVEFTASQGSQRRMAREALHTLVNPTIHT